MRGLRKRTQVLILVMMGLAALLMMGSEGNSEFVIPLVIMGILAVVAKVTGAGLARVFGLPEVLGELLLGLILGNLGLLGTGISLDFVTESYGVQLFAFLGVNALLFRTGLESNLDDMLRVGLRAFVIALVGVFVPGILGALYIYASGWGMYFALAVATGLAATSVGITARIFSAHRQLKGSLEETIIIGAAVIDDVLGLIILAITSAVITTGGGVDVAMMGRIFLTSFGFLALALVLGRITSPMLSLWFSKIDSGFGMKTSMIMLFFIGYMAAAYVMGLEPIIGSFAAGLHLDTVHFKGFEKPHLATALHNLARRLTEPTTRMELDDLADKHTEAHVEDLISFLVVWMTPLYFVLTGMKVDLRVFADPEAILMALVLTVLAVVGKLACGLVAGRGVNKWIIGWGMVPRGEVGIIVANLALVMLGMDFAVVFSALIICVLLTTLIGPLALNWTASRMKSA